MGVSHIPPPAWMTDPEERLIWNIQGAVLAGHLLPPPPNLHGEELRAWATAGLKARVRMWGWVTAAVTVGGGLWLWFMFTVGT